MDNLTPGNPIRYQGVDTPKYEMFVDGPAYHILKDGKETILELPPGCMFGGWCVATCNNHPGMSYMWMACKGYPAIVVYDWHTPDKAYVSIGHLLDNGHGSGPVGGSYLYKEKPRQIAEAHLVIEASCLSCKRKVRSRKRQPD